MKQVWKKLGRLFNPEDYRDIDFSYASVPIADHVEAEVYRIYFSGRDKQGKSHTYSSLFDFASLPPRIVSLSKTALLSPGPVGFFDEDGSMGTCLLNVAEKKYLFYIGWSRSLSTPFRNAIGLAVSTDGGSTFTRVANGPVVDRSVYDPCFTASCSVLGESNSFRMWYLSCYKWSQRGDRLEHCYHIRSANSIDLLTWTRQEEIAVACREPEEYAISSPRVLKTDAGYRMWYSHRGSAYKIGSARSADGVNWLREDDEVMLAGDEQGWDSQMQCYPYVWQFDGQAHLMLYNGNGYGQTGFGLAIWDGQS